jgi:lipopolysaccharide export system protein LptA
MKSSGIHKITFRVMLCGLALLTTAAFADRTIITSETLEMQGTETRNYFYFRTDVVVIGTNLELQCDELTVTASRRGEEDDGSTVGEIGAIEQIVAVGNVRIHQAGRSAYAGRAVVNPTDGTVTLMDSPRVVDRDVEVEGYQFILHQGDRRFESIPDPNAPAGKPSRSVVRLGALPDLGFDQDEEKIKIGDRKDSATKEQPASDPINGEEAKTIEGEEPNE